MESRHCVVHQSWKNSLGRIYVARMNTERIPGRFLHTTFEGQRTQGGQYKYRMLIICFSLIDTYNMMTSCKENNQK